MQAGGITRSWIRRGAGPGGRGRPRSPMPVECAYDSAGIPRLGLRLEIARSSTQTSVGTPGDAMKTPSRSLVLTVVAFVVLAAAAAWWVWRTTGEPTVSFMEF